MMLSVTELRQRKQQLEQAIAELIQTFEQETSVEVEDLFTIERDVRATSDQDQQVVTIKVDIHLNM